MASLRKKPTSKFWFACITHDDGSRTQISTKTTNRKQAQKIANEYEEATRNRATESQIRRTLSNIHEEIHGTKIEELSLAKYVERWLERKKVETKLVTYEAYRSAAGDLASFLHDKASDPIQYINKADIAAWRDDSARRATARTANNKLKIIRTLFQCAWRDGLITDNPAAKVTVLKTKEAGRRPFTIPELKRILDAASPEWRGMILAGLYTGQRLKDIALLTWANIDMNRKEIALSTSKTGRRQIIPMAAPLWEHVLELPSTDNPTAPLFPNAYRIATTHKATGALSNQFHRLLENIGLSKPRPTRHISQGKGRSGKRETESISFHSLRHTATSLLKNAGVPEIVARDLIGHDSAVVSLNYTHVDEESKRKAIEKLPDIFTELQ